VELTDVDSDMQDKFAGVRTCYTESSIRLEPKYSNESIHLELSA
jgi:hypothetical protein